MGAIANVLPSLRLLLASALLAVGLLAAGAGEARADDAEERRAKAVEHYKRAGEAFKEEDYDRAIAELTQALGYERQPVFFQNISRAYEKKGDYKNAILYLEQYKELVEDRAKRKAVSDHLAELARLEKAQRTQGEIVLDVDLAGATVKVGRSKVGTTPLDQPLRLKVGKHRIRVSAGGYQEFDITAEVAAGSRQTVVVRMVKEEERAWLRIVVDERGAKVRLDGRPLGSGPIDKKIEVSAGPHELVVEAKGYQLFVKPVEVKAGDKKTLHAELELEEKATPKPPPVAVAPKPDKPKPKPKKARKGMRVAAWIFLVGAIGASAGGAGLMSLAETEYARVPSSVRDQYGASGNIVSLTQVEAEEAQRVGDQNAQGAGTLFVVGGVSALVSIVFFAVSSGGGDEASSRYDDRRDDERDDSRMTLRPMVGPDSAGLGVGWSF